jgi:hypothetical protein
LIIGSLPRPPVDIADNNGDWYGPTSVRAHARARARSAAQRAHAVSRARGLAVYTAVH